MYLILSTSTSKCIINFPSESFEKQAKKITSGDLIFYSVAKQEIKTINFKGKKKHKTETYPFSIYGSNDRNKTIIILSHLLVFELVRSMYSQYFSITKNAYQSNKNSVSLLALVEKCIDSGRCTVLFPHRGLFQPLVKV